MQLSCEKREELQRTGEGGGEEAQWGGGHEEGLMVDCGSRSGSKLFPSSHTQGKRHENF